VTPGTGRKLRTRRSRAFSEGNLGIHLTTSPFAVITSGADDLGNLVELFNEERDKRK
jgi:hypothetical protein